ncbi:MAG TPA: dihydroorotase [Myxococcota bacterium]|nr:dihydroorotase [Myxococcota bacterium]
MLVRGARLIDPAAGIDRVCDLLVRPEGITLDPGPVDDEVLDGRGLWAMAGLVDLQVHFRQPGFEYKETIETGSAAALAGGITTVVVMPNTQPRLDTPERVRFEAKESERVDGIRILVAAAATVDLAGERLTDHPALAGAGAVAITDDGLPVMDDALMEGSLALCAEHDLLFMQHAEDLRVSRQAPMTLGPTSEALGLRGQPADAEGLMVERDVEMALRTGARYHVLHTSTRRSLEAIRGARSAGARVSCEASPHHLLLTDEACAGGDPNFKMNPPLRCEDDRLALVEALLDGTIDAVATDHAPHSAEEKARGFAGAPFGVIGLETAFAALLSFVHSGRMTAEHAVRLMTAGPARVLCMPELGTVTAGSADLCLVDPHETWTVVLEHLRGRSKNSAFLGRTFTGRVKHTFLRGRLRYSS